MKSACRLTLSAAVAAALSAMPPSFVGAEDIDLFVGNGPAAQAPNVLIILDNSANWSAANQNWPGGIKQGQAELAALNQVVGALQVNENGSAKMNLGLMMFTEGTGGGNKDGGYMRFAIRPMTNGTGSFPDNNIRAFQDLVGDANCTYNPTTLNMNGTPNCIYGNFDKTEDQVGSGLADYQAAMFEAFHYFGGWTYPADANADPQFAATPPGNPQGADKFGPYRYAGNLSRSDFVARLDKAAFVNPLTTTPQYSTYQPPIDGTNNCASNYIIFIGNGYVDDSTAKVAADQALMDGVSGTDLTLKNHIPMAEFNTITNPTTKIDVDAVCHTAAECVTAATSKFGTQYDSYSCTGGTTSAGTIVTATTTSPSTCETAKQCETNGSTYLPGYTSYSCTGGVKSTCKGSDFMNWTVTGTRIDGACANPRRINQDVFGAKNSKSTVRTGFDIIPPTSPDYKEKLADEWARYLFSTDVNAAVSVQNVKTYVIDVFHDQPSAAQNSLLFNMARASVDGDPTNRTYFQATNAEQLLVALQQIFSEIQSKNSVFAAASLPVSATNRAQNENQVFFGLFRPDKSAYPRWYGNLKRYEIQKSGTSVILAGQQVGFNVVDDTSGFFKDCAKSFWTTDSGSYWSFSGAGSGCPLGTPPPSSVYSDLPDGPQVEKGGAAEVLRRGNDPASPSTAVNRNMFSCANDGTTIDCSSLVAFADGTTSITANALGATTDAERTNIIDFTRGHNVKNEVPGDTTQARPTIHGDVVHSRPLPVNYATATDKSGTKVVVFYGANDGTLKAVSTNDGKELWSFIAPEHHSRLKRLYANEQKVAFPNVLAEAAALAAAGTPVTPPPAPKDYFFDGTIGVLQSINNSTIRIFPTMRRGGRMVYAFDVAPSDPANPTLPTAPTLRWRAGCPNLNNNDNCTPGFTDGKIGQTWSTPNVAFIKNFSTTVPVIVMGGGYDTCEDKDGIVTSECDDAKGRKVYILNADTGEVIRSFETERSVPADMTLVDSDFDGFVDHAYAADTGGNVYRVDFTGADKDAWSSRKVGHVASNSGRKFLFPPAALVAKDASGNTLVFLALGSGNRERPLFTNYPVTTLPQLKNRFYTFVDRFDNADVDLEALDDITPFFRGGTTAPCTTGWRLDLLGDPKDPPDKIGEQTVTAALIAQGRVFWNTARATQAAPGTCNSDLGESRGYNVGLFCPDVISTTYVGGGLAITPVLGTVTLADGSVVTVCIGCAMSEKQKSQFTPGQVTPAPAALRKKRFWKRDGDK